MLVPEAYFYDRDNVWINERAFGTRRRTPGDDAEDLRDRRLSEGHALRFRRALSGSTSWWSRTRLCMPMHIPLGVALTHFIAETEIPTIAHHHDFYWERARFSVNAVNDFLTMAFPPTLRVDPARDDQLVCAGTICLGAGASRRCWCPTCWISRIRRRTRRCARADFRERIGLAPDDVMLLQPTRVVPRKGIEHSIALVAQLQEPAVQTGRLARVGRRGAGLSATRWSSWPSSRASTCGSSTPRSPRPRPDADQRHAPRPTWPRPTPQADLITYPSLYEGFGNALLEAFYYRKPVLVNRYSIFVSDIEPKGFKVIAMDGFLTRSVLEHVRRVIADEAYRQRDGRSQLRIGQGVLQLRRAAPQAPLADHQLHGAWMTLVASETSWAGGMWSARVEPVFALATHAVRDVTLAIDAPTSERLYGDRADGVPGGDPGAVAADAARRRRRPQDDVGPARRRADHLRRPGPRGRPLPLAPPSAQFLGASRARIDVINTVHLLPFFPYSSDDGFSVIDYRRSIRPWATGTTSGRLGRTTLADVRPGAQPRLAPEPLVRGLRGRTRALRPLLHRGRSGGATSRRSRGRAACRC